MKKFAMLGALLGVIIWSSAQADERWAGSILVPDARLDILVKTATEGGATVATISIPIQSLTDAALQDVAVDGRSLRFTLGKPNPRSRWARFDVQVSKGRDEAMGWMAQSKQAYRVVLQRLAPGVSDRFGYRGPPPPPPGKSWRGQIALSADLALGFAVRLDAATQSGRLDIPTQGVHGNPLHTVAIQERRLGFTFRPPGLLAAPAVFDLSVAGDGAVTGTMTQRGRTFPVTAASITPGAEARPARPQEPRAPFPYRVREVTVPNPGAGVTLAGTLTFPSAPGRHPVALLLSGSGAQDRDESLFGHRPFFVLADHLTRQGIAVLRLDDRGTGQSTGNHAKATTADFGTDARAAVAFLARQPEVDPSQIGLIGHSEGGWIAGTVAGAEKSAVAWVVLLASPATSGRDIILYQTSEMATPTAAQAQIAVTRAAAANALDVLAAGGTDAELRDAVGAMVQAQRAAGAPISLFQFNATVTQGFAQMRAPWYQFFAKHDPTAQLKRIRVPVLALNGTLDTQVRAAVHLPATQAALANNPDATIVALPGLNHLFQTAKTGSLAEYAEIEETFSPAAMAQISSWIRARR